ncbi:FKBP-type peptidyl-prolyl cis-trans isomerase [Phenylobacterium sp.]|uniref:FKBP-type peptidyl-prolyl cis-trans isomerase n=1 Tax=Phenylobacterium sp. TaxID=1871053 RepID=UPI0025F48A88|nr:FKBP-type peptidyl-prolyl cis-trans isomerase [Phenylobacterium sp.]
MRLKLAGGALALTLCLGSAVPAMAQERTMPAVSYTVLQAGPKTKPPPVRASAVQVRYVGRLEDGSVFDTSDGKGGAGGTAVFPLRGLIGGFQAALMQMQPGDKWRVRIPPEFAYGQAGSRLSGKTLIFDIELVDWAELPAAPPPAMTELPKPK